MFFQWCGPFFDSLPGKPEPVLKTMESYIRDSIVKEKGKIKLPKRRGSEFVSKEGEGDLSKRHPVVDSRSGLGVITPRQIRSKDRYIKRYISEDAFFLRTPVFKPEKVGCS